MNNKSIGVVESKKSYFEIEEELKREVNNRFTNVKGKDVVSFRRNIKPGVVSSREDIINKFSLYSNITVETWGIFCESKYLALVDNSQEYDKVVNGVKDKYKNILKLKNIENFKISNIKLKKCSAPLRMVCFEVKASNEKAIGEILKHQDCIRVEFIGKVEKLKQIQPSTSIKSSKEMLKGSRKIQQEGQEGLKCVNTKITVKSGKIVKKDTISEKIIKPCKDKIILVGSKNPAILGAACFSKPSRGSISSGFGSRWGRMHNGIDIAASSGSPIYAAYEGTVSFAGWQDGYGNLVIVDHGDGFETRYGHCSKLLVKVGQKIEEGTLIANVGSTGRSTGPHLHFEVRKDGVPVNPVKYLK